MTERYKTSEEEILALLYEIVALWPRKGSGDVGSNRDRLKPFLGEDFEDVDLLNRISGVVAIDGFNRTDRDIEIRFFDADGWLQRAVFKLDVTGKWRVNSLKFQCPVCFGDGVNDGESCDICGGLGWGAS